MQMYTRSLKQAMRIGTLRRKMNWTRLASLLSAMLVLAVSGLATTIIQHSVVHAAAPSNTAVTTYKYDNARSGANTNETILNTTNVSSATFGKRVSYPVDGQVYAQPLYVPNLTIGGTTHNVVFAETEHDSIYAFDADQTTPTPAYLWQTSYLTNGATSVPYTAVSCNDLQPEIGITGTPVIDTSTNTMYVVADTLENGAEVYRLHAVDITTGQDKPGSPTVIQASVPGTGSGAVNGTVTFNALKERQRGALLMANGQIYIAFGSFCDDGPYHGWIMSYTYNGATFQQASVYNDTPNASGGGYWGGGSPLTADSAGNIYAVSGNGDFDYGLNGGVDVADAVVKLNPQLQVQDYMGPFNQYCLKQFDTDLGSGGPLLLPSQNEVISVGKEGRIYVMNTTNLGQYTPDPNLTTQAACGTNERLRTDLDKVVQELPPTTIGGSYSNPVSWTGPTGQYVYFTGSGDHVKAFQLTNGLLSTAPTSQSPESFSFAGGNAVVSSDGTASGTGILWQIDPHAVLRAYDATNLSKELYNTAQVPGRDGLDSYVKFSSPTVANGEVFVGTNDSLVVYGLPPTPNNATPTPTPAGTVSYNNIGISDDSAPTVANFDYAGSSYSSQAIQNDGINPGDNAFFNSMVFTWPNAVAGSPDNYLVNGQTIPVTPIANANVLGLLGAATGGPSYGTATINFTDGSTQTFQVGFSDWTLGGGGNPISFNNGTMATMAYRNTAAGKDPTITYIFYADVATPAGKVVQSVTLPSTTTGGVMHIFAAATKVGTASNTFPTTTGTPTPTPTGTPTTTAPPYNNRGTSDDSATSAGAFDGANSYSAQALVQVGVTPGNPVSFAGVTFTWPKAPSGQPNNYTAKGQVIPITPASGDNLLAFLGSASGGNSSGTATITYTDGSTQTFTLGFGDWTRGGNGTDPLVFGDQLMATTSYRNTPTGQQPSSKPVIFFVSTPLQSGKTIQSVTLPTTVTGGQLHVFTIATANSSGITPTPTATSTPTAVPSPSVTASPSPTASPTPTPAVYNNKATSDDSAPTTGNFDGANSYSAQALKAVGVTPGSTVLFNGVAFTWPTPVSGQPNNYVCKGQILPVTPVSNATTLAFLGSASGGNSSGTATITYTDGSTQTFTLGFNDWTRGGNGTDPLVFGDQVVVQTAYRNTPTGQQQTAKPSVFYVDVTLQAGKTVQSVTLPATTTGGKLHIFAVATK